MNTRKDKSRKYFKALLDSTEQDIDYSDIAPTTREQWEDAEVLLPVTADEFRAVRQFIENRRRQRPAQRETADS